VTWKNKKRHPFKQVPKAEEPAAEQDAPPEKKRPQDMSADELEVALYEQKLRLWQEQEKELRARQRGTYQTASFMTGGNRPMLLAGVFKRKRRLWK
jgi:hypothetical protein